MFSTFFNVLSLDNSCFAQKEITRVTRKHGTIQQCGGTFIHSIRICVAYIQYIHVVIYIFIYI